MNRGPKVTRIKDKINFTQLQQFERAEIKRKLIPFFDLPPGFGGAMALTARGLGGRRWECLLRKLGVGIEEEEAADEEEKGGRKEEERTVILHLERWGRERDGDMELAIVRASERERA